MKIYSLIETCGRYDERATVTLGVFSSQEKALDIKNTLDKNKDDIEEACKKIFAKINNISKDKKSGFYYDELTDNKDIVDSVLSTYNQTVKDFIQNNRIYSGLEINSWREIIEFELDDFDVNKHSFL